jgi:ribulose-phosphate 3-epimerase
MKISASIYSDKKNKIERTIELLADNAVDLIHVDCKDDLSVFEDIKLMRQGSSLPIDLHIITDNPEKYFDLITEHKIEYVAFQHEPIKDRVVDFPNFKNTKFGISIVTSTPVEDLNKYSELDFILMMATIPGESGGKFDKSNFQRIRKARKLFPKSAIHVDGGVNAEVAFLLRTMGVSVSISGSFLFNSKSVAHGLLELKLNETESDFVVEDFMIPLEKCPVISESNLDLIAVLQGIEDGKMGLILLLDNDNKLSGLVTNADIRRGMLKLYPNINSWNELYVNNNPKTINSSKSVYELLMFCKQQKNPLNYIPVIDNDGNAKGIVNFANLVKGEI